MANPGQASQADEYTVMAVGAAFAFQPLFHCLLNPEQMVLQQMCSALLIGPGNTLSKGNQTGHLQASLN
ncbi:hypothetical protein HMPREF0322_05443 [Desulfitobacterium hafniense DP7]|uniref:Uncharacterized protein n=1 Tax=Desulfitobacterium hafniense DP7 TaxID=537010 RepID=G9XWS6_DESHA|nr:hypothetical protein HMPREF0322_05443 [Desulfitobacterium hafniense DP7]